MYLHHPSCHAEGCLDRRCFVRRIDIACVLSSRLQYVLQLAVNVDVNI